MYLVTKRIDFCYGHRLLDYDGVCRNLHGHNAVVEIDIRTETLDARNMVVDFGDMVWSPVVADLAVDFISEGLRRR